MCILSCWSEAPRLPHVRELPSDSFLLALLLLYTPFGLCLMLLRIFIGLHVFLVSSAIPDSLIRRFIVRVMCSVLGMFVSQNDPRQRDKNVKAYVCNHVSAFDHNMINLLTPCNTPLLEGHSGFVSWARGYVELGWRDSRTRMAETLRQYSSLEGASPLLLFPEEEMTNGKVGLLKFSSWPFSVNSTLQPVGLTVKRPFISASVVESSWVSELLWMFFTPFTVYQHLAVELGIVSTPHTKSDKAEYVKRMKHVVSPVATAASHIPGLSMNNLNSEDMQMTGMARQVKEVLPHIPLSVINQDLVKTNCVDTTITNLLEGRIPFTPEDPVAGSSSEASSSQSTLAPSSSSCAVRTSKITLSNKPDANPTFEKSPTDRHLSLQERKEALYAYARRQYLAKNRSQPTCGEQP
uniref:Lipid droplet-regulating VLDL assembly factor AUP1 n=1 Tax=Callorhinchus milii TaxID=7868 RepID=A0A4W3ILN9_CALMI